MDWNTLFFVILPYVALLIAIVVTMSRTVAPVSMRSRSQTRSAMTATAPEYAAADRLGGLVSDTNRVGPSCQTWWTVIDRGFAAGRLRPSSRRRVWV